MQLCIHGLFELAWTLPLHLPYQQFVTYTVNVATYTFISTYTLATESDPVAQYIPTTTFVSLDAFFELSEEVREMMKPVATSVGMQIRDEARFTGVYQTRQAFHKISFIVSKTR